jgi:hypothetical protein
MLERLHRGQPVCPGPLGSLARGPAGGGAVGAFSGGSSGGTVGAVLAPAPDDEGPVGGEEAADDDDHRHVGRRQLRKRRPCPSHPRAPIAPRAPRPSA